MPEPMCPIAAKPVGRPEMRCSGSTARRISSCVQVSIDGCEVMHKNLYLLSSNHNPTRRHDGPTERSAPLESPKLPEANRLACISQLKDLNFADEIIGK